MTSLSRYEILSPLGDNHYAHFFKGYDVVGERDVCIIEFLEKFRKNSDRWQEIWRQILSAGRAKHDYMVSVYDYDRDRGWVITELMQGSLRDLPPEQLKSVELVRTVLYRTLETLDFLHSNNQSHGDVRPASLLYDIAGQSKLSYSPGIALGGQIARREKDHAFLAPELFDPSFGELGVGVDLYGCGMSALSLLLGNDFAKKVLGVAVSDDVAWQRFHRDVNSHPSVRALLPSLPSDMEQVIQKLISKKVDQRFTSIAEARALLSRPAVEVRIQVADAPHPVLPVKRSNGGPPPEFAASPQPAVRSRTQTSTKPRPVRDWLNKKLKNPLVMGLISAFIVGCMVFAMALISAIKQRQQPIMVALSSKPTGATIYIDAQKAEGLTNAQLPLKKGKHKLKLELSGFQSVENEFDIPLDAEKYELHMFELTPAVAKVQPKAVHPAEKKAPPVIVPPKVMPPVVTPPVQVVEDIPIVPPAIRKTMQNSLGMTLIFVEPGEFDMGAPESDLDAQANEKPLHHVVIEHGFYLGETEVTLEQWEQFIKLAPYTPESERPGSYVLATGYDSETQKFVTHRRFGWRSVGWPQSSSHPVVNVTYGDAVEFCKWLSEKEEKNYRLPYSTEWEFACRAGTTTRYWNGNRSSEITMVDNVADESLSAKLVKKDAELESDGYEFTSPVMAYDEIGRNPWGLFGMHGNASEWCLPAPAKSNSETDTPDGGSEIVRGGSWYYGATAARSSALDSKSGENCFNYIGFRVACEDNE